MSDEEALLAAIAASPDEDTPRLVYADWLDEHDQPIRAEFIRVQIEVARVETLESIDLNRHIDLFQRQHDLLENHRAELLGALARVPKVEFERGFVSELVLSFIPFYRQRRIIAVLLPFPTIIVRDTAARVRNMLSFSRSEAFSDAYSHLVAAIGTIPEQTAAERSLARQGPELEPLPLQPLSWPRLAKLDVSGCRLGDENAARLLRPESFPILADLDLSGNYLTDALVSSLLNSGLPSHLKCLILGGNPIGDDGAIELAERWPTGNASQLKTLNLRYTNIGQPGQSALLARFGGIVDLF